MRKKWVLVIGILSGIIVTIKVTIFVFLLVFYICPPEWMWPEYNLGNNIYMMEWDGGGRIVVLCSHVEGKECYGGSQLIPTNENHCDSLGRYVEYVVTAKSDERWVIVKTNNKQSRQSKYYVINKDYDPNEMTAQDIIDTKIECFTDRSEFDNYCLKNGINIKVKW